MTANSFLRGSRLQRSARTLCLRLGGAHSRFQLQQFQLLIGQFLAGGTIHLDAPQPQALFQYLDLQFRILQRQELFAHCGKQLRRQLALQLFEKLVGEASDGPEAVQKTQELQPDMILLDVNLPKLNGFEVARRVREHTPQLKITFFSADRSFDTAEDALRMGAYGYVVKSDAGTQLVPALEATLQGKQFVSSSLGDRVFRRLHPAAL